MNWLDGVMAVPGIGIQTKANFKYVTEFRQRLEYFIEQLKGEYEDVIIESSHIWGYSLTVKGEGFRFDLTHKNLLTTYSYAVNETPQAGKLPILELPKLRTFSELFEKSAKYMADILENLERLSDFYFDRIGIVADVAMEKDSLPPGLVKWIDYIGKPWNKGLSQTILRMTATLNEEQSYYERCHHHLTFDRDQMDKKGFNLKLDWQRVFNQPYPLKTRETIKQLNMCKEKAYEYFQRFGEGDLSYD